MYHKFVKKQENIDKVEKAIAFIMEKVRCKEDAVYYFMKSFHSAGYTEIFKILEVMFDEDDMTLEEAVNEIRACIKGRKEVIIKTMQIKLMSKFGASKNDTLEEKQKSFWISLAFKLMTIGTFEDSESWQAGNFKNGCDLFKISRFSQNKNFFKKDALVLTEKGILFFDFEKQETQLIKETALYYSEMLKILTMSDEKGQPANKEEIDLITSLLGRTLKNPLILFLKMNLERRYLSIYEYREIVLEAAKEVGLAPEELKKYFVENKLTAFCLNTENLCRGQKFAVAH